MAVFQEPTKWAQSLGATANADVIPDEAGAMDVDISKIFPAVFSVPLSQGGKAIPRRTLNGLLKLLGDWLFYYQQGGVPSYDSTVDYAVGRVVLYTDGLYKCIQANDHTAPHNPTDKDYWVELSDSSDLDGKADRSLSNVDNTANILMAHNAMPSNVYDDLTLGASGSTYTAPADGYFAFSMGAQSGGIIQMVNNTDITYDISVGNNSNHSFSFIFPARKGLQVYIRYPENSVCYNFKFIYAIGSESEKV